MNLIPRHSIFDLDSFFDAPMFNHGRSRDGVAFSPKIDVRESDDAYWITAELPGVQKDNVKVTIDRGILAIEAEMDVVDKEEAEGRVIRCERRYGKYLRNLDLGPNIHEADVQADYKNGVLSLNIPKVHKEPDQEKSIKIN